MEFEEYQSPRRSKLFAHEELIRAMRAKNWPLSKVAEWLEKERGVKIAVPSLHSWCQRNGIKKGVVESTLARPSTHIPSSQKAPLKKNDDNPFSQQL